MISEVDEVELLEHVERRHPRSQVAIYAFYQGLQTSRVLVVGKPAAGVASPISDCRLPSYRISAESSGVPS